MSKNLIEILTSLFAGAVIVFEFVKALCVVPDIFCKVSSILSSVLFRNTILLVFPCTILSTESPYTSLNLNLSFIRNINAVSIHMHPHYKA